MLELHDLSFTVLDPGSNGNPVSRTIIPGFSYSFAPGRTYAITGPNGSGKTTLAKLIMGINQPTSGRIVLDDEEITNLSITERSLKGLAYGFQNPARFKGITFRDLLGIALNTDDESSFVHLLARVGICSHDFLEKSVDAKLSGGEIKKIELATIIAREPKLAIYDEPDTGIDLWTIGPMVELLKREAAERGTTTLIISHNRAFLRAADEVLLLKDGRLAHTGSYEETAPLLTNLSLCLTSDVCEGEGNVGCTR